MLPWDHNAYYHRLLLSAVPGNAARILEVGCGAGQLATQLATRAKHVDAIDRDAGMVTAARAAVPANVRCRQADVMATSLAPESYDAVVSMSTVHHLPLVPALSRLAAAVRPGGILAAVAQPRTELPHELPLELAATTWHHALGLAFTVTRYCGNEQLRRAPHHGAMPVHEPEPAACFLAYGSTACFSGVTYSFGARLQTGHQLGEADRSRLPVPYGNAVS